MSSENQDGRSLDKSSENSDVSKKPKYSYSREFLLALSNLNFCKKLPSGFDESLIRKPEYSYSRDLLLALSNLDFCKKVPSGFDESLSRMSSENEDGRSLDNGSENSDASKKPKYSYSREFLLALSNLDSCKKLPCGFDESLISEFEDALVGVPGRPKISGTFQGFRRSEYDMSPPTQGDGGNYSRGIHGKWDARSSLRNDRDSDSQSDRDSDSGRRFGLQTRRSWQSPEHDGLLGSGSFPKPSGYAAGVPASKFRANERSQLNWSNEPYHPPRPYKAVPHSKRDTDSLNDETFGSMECTGEDRVEAEKRRRASFEMMRKEQQKALQVKQKSSLEKHKGGSVISDLCEVLADSEEEKGLTGRNNELEVSGGIPILSNDLEKSSFSSRTSASRPLVPPGFKSNNIENSFGSKSLVHRPLAEVGKSVTVENLEDSDAYVIPSTNNGTEKRLSQELRIDDGQLDDKMHPALLLNKGENTNLHVVNLDVPTRKSGKEDELFQLFYQDSHATLGDPFIAELNPGVPEDKIASGSNRSCSSSILEKILGSTLSVDVSQSKSIEHYNGSKPEDTSGTWSPNSTKSSKFAQWFFEEEANATADISSSVPNDLLSFIVSGDKVNGVSDQVLIKAKEEDIPAILTCEDLEQSILSEYIAKTTDVPPAVEEGSNLSDANGEKPCTYVDNHASLHLLSMLKKSTDLSITTANTIADIYSADSPFISEETDIAKMINKHRGEENVNTEQNLGRTLTLETLFGTAFMKELQSVEAPVSVQRGSIGPQIDNPSEPHGLSSPMTGRVQRPNHDFSLSINHTQGAKASGAEKWLGFGNQPTGEILSKGVDFQVPRENYLFSVGDSHDPRVSKIMKIDNSISSSSLSSNATINIKEKLGMKGSGSLPFPFGSYEKMEPAIYRNMQIQQSSPQFHPTPQMPHATHLDSPLAHMGSQLKFLGQDPILNHDPHTNNQITANIIRPSFQHSNVAGVDIPFQHLLMHQMQMPGNHSPQVPLNGDQRSGFFKEMDQAQGFSFGPHQPNTGGCGMPISGNPSEAFQRLVEMELQANSKQIHPLSPSHNTNVAMRGYELDMGFQYR